MRVEPSTVRLIAVWAVIAVLVSVLALRALDALAHLGFLLLVSWMIAVAAEPAVEALERRGMKRGGAVALIATGTIVLIFAFAAILGGTLVTQLDELRASAPAALESVSAWVSKATNGSVDLKGWTSGNVNVIIENLGGNALGLVGSLLGSVFDAVTIAVFSVYLATGAPRLQRRVARLLPARQQEVMLDVWSISVNKAGGFVISKLALAGISAAAHTAAFYALGVPYWLPMGLFAGVVSQFVPVVGTYVGVALPVVLALEVDPWTALWVVVFAIVYQQVENYLLTPKISGKTMDLNAGLALAAVIAGAALLGPVGALLGMPLAAIIEALIDGYAHRYELHPEVAEQTKARKKPGRKRGQ